MGGFTRWLAKRGTMGGAARLIIRAYHEHKTANPNTPDKEIFEAVVKWRYSITGEPLTSENLVYLKESESPREFVHRIVFRERAKDLIGISPASIREIDEVIDKICDQKGV